MMMELIGLSFIFNFKLMRKFLVKLFFYAFLCFLAIEGLVRVFHLHNERPSRFLDDQKVEKWVPYQEGYSVTGNRRQNVGYYRINSMGFNSQYDVYEPTDKGKEIALIGDSFIEGFHQDVEVSLGQKVELLLKDEFRVYEFGYAGYDMADQLHLMEQYKELFDKNRLSHHLFKVYGRP